MRRVLFSSLLILFIAPMLTMAQRDSVRNIFLSAESWFLFEEYAEAIPLYKSLLKSDPGNDNLNYKIGICLLNDPYQKDKAIQYLIDASDNINPNYKENNFKERTAPPDALYFLGNAYLVNELLDLAIETFENFLVVMDHDTYDEELVLAQIRSCKNAQRLKTMPVDIDLTLMDSLINTRYADIHPVVSGDGKKVAFVTELPFYDGAFYTEKSEDGWSYPQMITQMLGFDADIYPVALSYDGTEMILYYDDDYIGNLYYSRFENGLWNPATIMGENISTKYWESHASFSKDGKSLYFTSNRKGTNGGLDIYISERQPDGSWGVPINLGTTINSRYNEESPYISQDGQTLYFSSYGHYNMGGYDIFFSKKNEDGSWAEPVNVGYPINTTDDDLYFQPFNNGNGAYYSIYSPKGMGEHDIYYMNIYSANNPRLYYVTGNIHTEDGRIDSSPIEIFVIDSDKGDTLIYTKPSQEGLFAFQLKQGIYELHFEGEGYDELIRPLNITTVSNKRGITLDDNMELALQKVEPQLFEGDESRVKLKKSQFDGVAGIPIVVPITAPKGSTVAIRTYQDSALISTDTLVMERRKTDLQIVPIPGVSEVELEMIDKSGATHRNSFIVVGSEPVSELIEQELQKGELENEQRSIADESDDGGDQQPVITADPDHEDPVGILMLQMKDKSEGALHEELVRLDSSEMQFTNKLELFEYLYEEAGEDGYSKKEVDELLSEQLSDGSAPRLRKLLIENSGGPLQQFLEQLDLESEGIRTDQELFRYLEKKSETEGFTLEDVRRAMLSSLDKPVEKNSVNDTHKNRPGWPLLILIILAGSGLTWFFIVWWRRRDKREKQGE